MKLYCPPENHVLAKLTFTAKLARQDLTVEPVPYGYKNKHVQEHNALFTLPALELSPGKYVFGTHSIMRTLCNNGSLTPFQQVLMVSCRHR